MAENGAAEVGFCEFQPGQVDASELCVGEVDRGPVGVLGRVGQQQVCRPLEHLHEGVVHVRIVKVVMLGDLQVGQREAVGLVAEVAPVVLTEERHQFDRRTHPGAGVLCGACCHRCGKPLVKPAHTLPFTLLQGALPALGVELVNAGGKGGEHANERHEVGQRGQLALSDHPYRGNHCGDDEYRVQDRRPGQLAVSPGGRLRRVAVRMEVAACRPGTLRAVRRAWMGRALS